MGVYVREGQDMAAIETAIARDQREKALKAARAGWAHARSVVNRDTGNLRNHIKIFQDGDVIGFEVTGVDYAGYQEHLPPPRGRPYMRPGFEVMRQRMEELNRG